MELAGGGAERLKAQKNWYGWWVGVREVGRSGAIWAGGTGGGASPPLIHFSCFSGMSMPALLSAASTTSKVIKQIVQMVFQQLRCAIKQSQKSR